ncbi:hypothetical protein KKG24_04810 [Patescibacteria group bacterium]|nr:hypothetical protein [Patescibacteria group bacterium]
MSYPNTVNEVIDESAQYPQPVIDAVTQFKNSNPWRGTAEERKIKFQLLHDSLCQIYEKDVTLLFSDIRIPAPKGSSGSSSYSPYEKVITIRNKLSVVTYTHEFGHALGFNERQACHWSLNLFKQVFPEKYAKLNHVNHTVQ